MSAFASLCIYLLIGLMAALSLFCVIAGAEIYRGAVAGADLNTGLRAGISYVTGKVRAADARGCVRVEASPEGGRLVLTEEIDGTDYAVNIYHWEGQICELYTFADAQFDPEAGQPIAEAEAFAVTMPQENLIELELRIDGALYGAHIALRSAEEA